VTVKKAADGNYLAASAHATVAAAKAPLKVTASSLSKVYGSSSPPLTYTITGFVNGETQATATKGLPALKTTATISSQSGSYPITVTGGTLTAVNYNFSFVNGTLTVTKAPLKVTANNLSKVYGSSNPPLTYTITGFVNGETQATATKGLPALKTTATISSRPGSYLITVTAGTLTAVNYNFSFGNGALTVTKASLKVTASNLSKVYGSPNPPLTYTITGFVNGETQTTATKGLPALKTTATISSRPGSYLITVTAGTLTAVNYNFTFVNGTLTVTKASLKVKANNQSKVYGSPNPPLTYTITGFVNGETQATATKGLPALRTTATISSQPGSYPITVTAGTLTAVSYNFTFVGGTLTVTKASLKVKASNLSKVYGSPNPPLTYTITGFVNGETQATATEGMPALKTTATISSHRKSAA
jgi:major membrane immunogen (membrane-anchored lipoprotein)